jgi:hypothetical protein
VPPDLVHALPYITGPLTLIGFLALVLAWMYKLRLGSAATLQHEFELSNTKLTKADYFALRTQHARYWFWGCLTVCGLLLAAYLITTHWSNQMQLRDVDVMTRYDKKILDDEFKLDYRLPDSGPGKVESGQGKATIRGVPKSLGKLEVISVAMNGYEAPPGKYPIENNAVVIDLLPTERRPTKTAKDYPNVQPYLPTDDEMKQAPKVERTKVLLMLTNRTNNPLSLLLYNCDKPANSVSRWLTIPLPPSAKDKPFDKLPLGNGWFVAYAEAGPRQWSCLGTVNLQESESPTLVVEPGPDHSIYIGKFDNVKRSQNSLP